MAGVIAIVADGKATYIILLADVIAIAADGMAT